MLALAGLLSRPSTFVLFLAPPASGKTTLVLDLWAHYPGKIVFLSPLRALAQEFCQRARSQGIKASILTKRGEVSPQEFERKKKFLLVATVETLDEGLWGIFEKERPLFVVDEFHLFYSWGSDFRPLLWEGLMRIANANLSILGLSATVNPSMLEQCRQDFVLGMDEAFCIDCGNQQFLHLPENILFIGRGGPRTFRLIIGQCLAKGAEENYLIFCRYRHQVKNLVNLLKNQGIQALGCVGGEVAHFTEAMKKGRVEVIVATSCLSHGVNLPQFQKVFIAYPLSSYDMWLQMAARGGRRGEPYLLYQCNKFSLPFFKVLWDTLRLLSFDFFYRFLLLWRL